MVVPCTAVSNMSKLVMMWVSHDCLIQTELLTWKLDVCWSHISTCFTFSLLWTKGCKIFNPIDHNSLDMFSSCMCLTHGLHLNSCGEKKLALLFAKSFSDNNVSGISCTLIIINATNSPFFSSKAKAQRYLRYDWNYVYIEFRNQDRTVDSSNTLQIFQRNIRGLRTKTDELINSFETGIINPHVLHFSNRNMEEQDPLHLTLPGYILGSSFCCQSLQK